VGSRRTVNLVNFRSAQIQQPSRADTRRSINFVNFAAAKAVVARPSPRAGGSLMRDVAGELVFEP
jgi:hypothetical protein